MKPLCVAALLVLCSCIEVQRRPVYVPPPHPAGPVYLPPQPGPAAITADQAAQIAAGYASQRGFNVHKVKRAVWGPAPDPRSPARKRRSRCSSAQRARSR